MAKISSSSTSIPIDKPEDTPATDGIQGIEKWLEEGIVNLEITRINMHGAPGAGKTCSQHLLLNEPPPSSTDSTPIACRAVKATRISIDDRNKKWERVEIQDLLNQLASHLEENMKEERISLEVDEAPKPKNDAPNCSDELSVEEPTKIKPIDMEVIKKIANVLETGKSKKLSTNWVYFIDSGGQPAYRELLPLFTRAAALNIITIDLTKGLDEKYKFQYRICQNAIPIQTKLQYSNRGIIQSTISSEAMLNPIKIPYVSDMPKHPHYLILGTRVDELKEKGMLDRLDYMNKKLINEGFNNLIKPQNEGKGSVIFPVNTLLPAGSKEREEASVELCTAISHCRVAMTIMLPIRLFTFEISLQLEAKKKQQSFLTRGEVIEIGKSLQLDDESEIDDALQYLHNVTIILYYPAVLPNIIFVDPKPVLDVLSCLIAIRYVDHKDRHLIANPPPSPDETRDFIKYGLFKGDFIKSIGKKFFNKDFKLSHMITLLKHLHIIAKVENREEGDYFFPCALPSYDKLNPASKVVRPLLIAWEIHNRGTTTLAIPQGLFPLTIVHLLEKKDIVDFCPVGKEYYRCHDAMSLCVYEKYYIDIINCYTHIEIRFDDCKESCPEIRKLVTEAIKRSSKDLNVDDDHIFAFKCPSENEQCYCIVQEDKYSARCTQCRSKCDILQSDDDSYECWFNNPQLPSPGAESPSTKMQPTKLLDTSNLIDVLDVLDDHGYSGVSYYKLGLCLGLLPRTLDVIKENNKGDTKSCLRKCLTAWLEQRDSVMKRGVPTYDTLIRALRKMGENAAADGIERGINTKQLEEDEVELKATNINMHDAPGADGSQHLLNEPPPEKLTDSTQESESKEESN
ncbi:PREDICTED: uncharacterized protein LOC109587808 [Amphimedon queenslandica]|uniref:Death domain-containing protein n=3 Tax=Amphimedon queenslandica TaxID=400682 RepID=A0AAN0JRV8_AMPQE|nr:PREDICTED: uncharacterized protein LOC109587808 [Amphimedon queenslandica]|eukprot:XP_019859587.1 PREDICTED: uncharacterized protein LOC109587808 [Amphimedon queenslandica]